MGGETVKEIELMGPNGPYRVAIDYGTHIHFKVGNAYYSGQSLLLIQEQQEVYRKAMEESLRVPDHMVQALCTAWNNGQAKHWTDSLPKPRRLPKNLLAPLRHKLLADEWTLAVCCMPSNYLPEQGPGLAARYPDATKSVPYVKDTRIVVDDDRWDD